MSATLSIGVPLEASVNWKALGGFAIANVCSVGRRALGDVYRLLQVSALYQCVKWGWGTLSRKAVSPRSGNSGAKQAGRKYHQASSQKQ